MDASWATMTPRADESEVGIFDAKNERILDVWMKGGQIGRSLANSRPSRLCVQSFDPLSAPCGSHEWIRKGLCFPRNLVVPELHDAHGVGRLAVICQDEFGDPKTPAANDPSDSKPLFARLTRALALYVASTAGSLA